jgi:sulfate permease, SulP family
MKKTIINDLLAGLSVSFAALSLGAAFGIMSGRGAFAGMLAASIIPIITSVFGGTRLQASGPTAPMTAVTALIVAYAYDNFTGDKALAEQYITMVLFLSGVFVFLAGIFRLGKYIQLVPQVVVLGFMNGIAVLIWIDQLKKLFGLGGVEPLQGGVLKNSLLAFGVLVTIYLIPYLLKKAGIPDHIKRFIPAIFVTIVLFTIETEITHMNVSHVNLGTRIDSFQAFTSMVVAYFPTDFRLFQPELIFSALKLALQLCVLAYLDSLLTSLVIDKMTREKTWHNKELLAQGFSNSLTAIFQGIPGAQATIRSVLLLKEGAQTRMAGIFVGVFSLLGILVFGNLIVHIASAVFVGILLKAGLDVLDRDFPIAYLKFGWFSNRNRNLQLFIILYTTILTVVIDLNVAVITGTLLFYGGKYILGMVDAESEFAEVHSDELLGNPLEAETEPQIHEIELAAEKHHCD